VDRTFESLRDVELQWVSDRLAQARDFGLNFDPQSGGELTLASLDRAFERFLSSDHEPSRANEVINAVGVAFGVVLVAELSFQWVITTDDFGTDLAVLARPGRGDVTIVPTDFVSKRYERRETPFLVAALEDIKRQLDEVALEWGDTLA
jgi:hypothetical protein